MGQFANTLFSLLLGWVQTAVSWLWGLITNTDVSYWFRWLLENWLPLTLMLCVLGVLIDFVVYLIRWQPYRVWRSFFRRRANKKEISSEAAASPVLQRQWMYADGSTEVEDISGQALTTPVQPQEAPSMGAARPTRRVARRASPEQAYNQPFYPPQWQYNTQDQQGENE